MFGLPDVAANLFWQKADAPIRYIDGGPMGPELERPLEYLEVILFGLVASVNVVFIWDAIRTNWRERRRRDLQEQWRNRLQARVRADKRQGRAPRAVMQTGRSGQS